MASKKVAKAHNRMTTHRVSKVFANSPFERMEPFARHVFNFLSLWSSLDRSSVGQRGAQAVGLNDDKS
jgi:hypothetical protein